MKTILLIMLITMIVTFGVSSLLKYMVDNDIDHMGWNGLGLIILFSLCSIVVIPYAIAKKIVSELDYKMINRK